VTELIQIFKGVDIICSTSPEAYCPIEVMFLSTLVEHQECSSKLIWSNFSKSGPIKQKLRAIVVKCHCYEILPPLSILTTIFPGGPGLAILDSISAKDGGGGGDNWSYKTCKAPVKSSPPTNNQFFTGRMPFLSPNQQC